MAEITEQRLVAQWWKRKGVPLRSEPRILLQAIQEVSFAALSHIMRRLQDPKVPDATKDVLALALAPKPPKLVLRQELGAYDAMVQDAGKRQPADLLQAYDVTALPPS